MRQPDDFNRFPELDVFLQEIYEQGERALNQCQERARRVEQLVRSSSKLLHRGNVERPVGKTPEVSAEARTQVAQQSARADSNSPPRETTGRSVGSDEADQAVRRR